MSAFIISEATANMIVSSMIEMAIIDQVEAQGFLSMMIAVNTKSVNTRYNESDAAPDYCFSRVNCGFDGSTAKPLLQIVTLIDCFNYQSCEFEGYENTLVVSTLQSYRDDLLASYKEWLVNNKYHNGIGLDDVSPSSLPFANEMQWDL
ncbi:hypothetical protein FH968_19965 [Buttiauxella sp. B2]|uniref:hypothetical protein n=1 Tax=Buttiauxella sp. B2 TaxID=2587812 RepID=UPI0011215CDA|nr:hypothetical protein [Buttiauxella sp. B2]TNV16118.1 hypothetical protein FH968_19965 [Buttiauxella sp. B2]